MAEIIVILIMIVIMAVSILVFCLDKNKQKKEREKAELQRKKYGNLDEILRSNTTTTRSSDEKIAISVYTSGIQNMFYVDSRERITIGRMADNIIAINEPSVSKNHAVVYKRGTGLIITDRGSVNGTFIERGMNSIYVEPGKEFGFFFNDTLRLGNVHISFTMTSYGG